MDKIAYKFTREILPPILNQYLSYGMSYKSILSATLLLSEHCSGDGICFWFHEGFELFVGESFVSVDSRGIYTYLPKKFKLEKNMNIFRRAHTYITDGRGVDNCSLERVCLKGFFHE